MAFRFLVHIGHSKAASSSIQAFLVSNKEALESLGFGIVDGSLEVSTGGNLNAFPLAPLNVEPTSESTSRIRDQLRGVAAKAARLGLDTAIISAENLCNGDRQRFFELEDLDIAVEVIYYVREHTEWLASAWKQWAVKQGQSLEDFVQAALRRGQPNYLETAVKWEAVTDVIHIRNLSASNLSGGSVYSDFCDACVLPRSLTAPAFRKNMSFDFSILEVFRRNPYLFSGRHDNALFNALESLAMRESQLSARSMLSSQLIEAIQQKFLDESRELDSRFGTDLGLALSAASSDAVALSREDIQDRAAGQMLQMIGELSRRVAELEKD